MMDIAYILFIVLLSTNILSLTVYYIFRTSNFKDIYLISGQILALIITIWSYTNLFSTLTSTVSLIFCSLCCYTFYVVSDIKNTIHKHLSSIIYLSGLCLMTMIVSKYLQIDSFNNILIVQIIVLILWHIFIIKGFYFNNLFIFLLIIMIYFYFTNFVDLVSNPQKYHHLENIYLCNAILNFLIGFFTAIRNGRISTKFELKRLKKIKKNNIKKD